MPPREADAELQALARELLARAEASSEEDWLALPEAGKDASPGRPVEAKGTVEPHASPPERAAEALGTVEPHRPFPERTAAEGLATLEREIAACRRCRLGSQRITAVPGVGSHQARVIFVGEGPGFDEDRAGRPFVGKAGALLDRILESIGLSRTTVYITNMVKCHPMADPSDPDKRGNDRPPAPDEADACRGYLDEQIRLIRPRFLVALGAVAGKALSGSTQGISRIRGTWREYRGIPLLPTYHPAALLRNPELKKDVWTDMKSLKRALETP